MKEANSKGLRWWWILFTGATVAVLDYVLIFLVVYAYVGSERLLAGGEPDDVRLDAVLTAFGILGLPLMHLLLVILAARYLAYRSDGRFVLYGILAGLVALVGYQLIGLSFGAFGPDEAVRSLLATLAGGWLGGVWGRVAVERREALYRASRDIELAQQPETVVEAIGEHLAGPDVSGVAVWRKAPSSGDETDAGLTLLATWLPRKGPVWNVEEQLDVDELLSLNDPGDAMPVVLRGERLRAFGEDVHYGREVRSVLLLPLRSAEAGEFGLLAVAFRLRRRVFRHLARGYQTIGVQAALALENLRLVEEARKAAVMGERQRLANEIHDTLAQGFNSIAINLDTVVQKIPPEPGPVRRLLNLSRSTARESLAEARRLVWALRPEALDRHSLPEAIALLAGRWSQETGVEAGAIVAGPPRQLSPEIESALLRTAQETLSNTRKHARAKRIMLTLTYMQNKVMFDSRDDGIGFDQEQVAGEVRDQSAGGFGLKAMRERIEQLGGTVHIESEPGEGTSLAVALPAGEGEVVPGKPGKPLEELH